ncbi:MAG: class I SAM-dependent rRNA methyltransferase [Leptospira sp.]|nr:class I SAM-dependent rRNA methyltransferase [Leptospira sp.]NCS95489.1 class I SAM-dependent rRNA methyltransferase [Leptospira sp.]
MNPNYPIIKIKDKSSKAFRVSKNPWVYSGAIHEMDSNIKDSQLVSIHDSKGQIGIGYLDQNGRIPIRFLTFSEQTVFFDENILIERLHSAWNLRSNFINLNNTNAFRFINSEGDFLPGMTIDIYNILAVISVSSNFVKSWIEIIQSFLMTKGIEYFAIKNENKEFSFLGNRSIEEITFKENNLRFHFSILDTQKTGFYLDQRQNRKKIETYASHRSGLNTFSFTGAFGIYAKNANARNILNIDSSQKSIEISKINQELNFPNDKTIEHSVSDVSSFLRELEKSKYDLIVLDPPAFAKTKKSLPQASRAYKDLNRNAFQKIAKNGIVFTFSCSGFMDKNLFRQIIFGASVEAGRKIQVLEELGHGLDHPVDIFHPEGEYLKGFILKVE